jgi:hypothetical protein
MCATPSLSHSARQSNSPEVHRIAVCVGREEGRGNWVGAREHQSKTYCVRCVCVPFEMYQRPLYIGVRCWKKKRGDERKRDAQPRVRSSRRVAASFAGFQSSRSWQTTASLDGHWIAAPHFLLDFSLLFPLRPLCLFFLCVFLCLFAGCARYLPTRVIFLSLTPYMPKFILHIHIHTHYWKTL